MQIQGVLLQSEKSTILNASLFSRSFLQRESFSECPDLNAWKCPIRGWPRRHISPNASRTL